MAKNIKAFSVQQAQLNRSTRQLGPIVGATLLCKDIERVSKAYQQTLGFSLISDECVGDSLAALWQSEALIGRKMQILASSDGKPWLRLIEDVNAASVSPLKTLGWMALETNVGNVDLLRKKLITDEFTIIGEPAYLQVSDAIKAMQIIGPAGEVSYLTQVERNVPPFELPQTAAETSSLFIPVLCTDDRSASLAFYEKLNSADKGLCFDTKVTVLNNAWKHNIEHQYPVATLQLDGKCLFEIDQVEAATSATKNEHKLPSGIALVTCTVKNIEQVAKSLKLQIHHIEHPYYPSRKVMLATGPCGELIEFVGE